MSIIKSIHIEQFRAMHDLTIHFNRPINAIIGKNGSMKTTLLGMLAQPFSLKTSKMSNEFPLSGGKAYNSPMLDKFKFSEQYDIPGEHKWTLHVDASIYSKESYTCLSERRKDNGKMRFWSTEGREKGMNYIQCPVIYLSMKRLMPVGEEQKLSITTAQLTSEEKDLYIRAHNSILISTERINDISKLESTNKKTIGPQTDYYDASTISAGQDNIGRIILAVLSMKRLHDKYPEEYHGGVICIDELESTLYPAAQEKILDYMYDVAKEYKIQFFFTTHSMSIINHLVIGRYHERNSITYLKRIGNQILAYENPSLIQIEDDLNVALGKAHELKRVKVYCEDDVAVQMCKAILPSNIKKQVEFVRGIDLGWTNYKNLVDHKIPEFVGSIIVLDGDVRCEKKRPKSQNVVFLPGDVYPERLVYEMLFNKPEADSFWDTNIGAFDKNMCFRDFPNYIEYVNRSAHQKSDTNEVKKWFRDLKAKKGYAETSKLFKSWGMEHSPEINTFVKSFVKSYNYIALKKGLEKIQIDE